DHLTSNINLHFDLVIKSFDSLQQTIRQYQVSLFIHYFNKKKKKFMLILKKYKNRKKLLKVKKDEEIAHLKQQLEQYQKDKLQLISAQKTTLIEMEKLKNDIKSKDNEIQKIKQ
ncbi:hypothetical protein RFI_37824, partial [Reticulomyxa filosa]